MIHYISIEELLSLHFRVIEDYGGSHGVRDEGRLESVISAPRQEIFGEEQYKSVFEKAAVYMRNIIGDHPFVDGNKRAGVTTCGVFLVRNNNTLHALPKDLEDFAVRVATDHLDVADIANWLEKHCQLS